MIDIKRKWKWALMAALISLVLALGIHLLSNNDARKVFIMSSLIMAMALPAIYRVFTGKRV